MKERVKRIAKRNGIRISKKAIEKLQKIVESFIEETLKKAHRNAILSGRKVIRVKDLLD